MNLSALIMQNFVHKVTFLAPIEAQGVMILSICVSIKNIMLQRASKELM